MVGLLTLAARPRASSPAAQEYGTPCGGARSHSQAPLPGVVQRLAAPEEADPFYVVEPPPVSRSARAFGSSSSGLRAGGPTPGQGRKSKTRMADPGSTSRVTTFRLEVSR